MNQTQIKETFNLLFEPLGMKTRTFVLEYRDAKNNYFHNEMTGIYIGSDKQIAEALTSEMEEKGFTVYCLYEILGDYTLSGLEKIIARNPQAGRKYTKPLFYDKNKERSAEL